MYSTIADESANSYNKSTTFDGDVIPCVQYGYSSGGPIRESKLRTIFDPIPSGAATASPVYLLTESQFERHAQASPNYFFKGDWRCRATQFQDECESEDRVLYPVHIESDEYLVEGPATVIGWYREFVEKYLEIPFELCTLYFSGHRSIHVHVPRFLPSEHDRKQLRELAKSFCEETGGELDCGMYDRKRMFRLPGVLHDKTGFRKVEIQDDWDHLRIIQKANTSAPENYSSYNAILNKMFSKDGSLVRFSPDQPGKQDDLFSLLDMDRATLSFPSEKTTIEKPLVERKFEEIRNKADIPKWSQYNAKEFSPYAKATANARSVAILKVCGGEFTRDSIRSGSTLVPAYFYGAKGCVGKEFVKDKEHAPLQLSKRDYAKWDYGVGECVAIIGGQSRYSRIFSVDPRHAAAAGESLLKDRRGRERALDYLVEQGYDVGKRQQDNKPGAAKTTASKPRSRKIRPINKPKSQAAQLQQRAEREGIQTLSHPEKARVACRLLLFGWEPAWEWFNEQFGSEFKPEVTWTQFNCIIEAYPEYDHIQIPTRPM